MIRGRAAVVGLCMLCALAFSAVGAEDASAKVGTTLFTCKKKASEGGAGFSREHCTNFDAVSTGATFEHVAFAENTTTEITGTSVNTLGEPVSATLLSVQAGIEEELRSALVHILPENEGEKSWVENANDSEIKEHYYHGEVWLRFTEVTIAKPAGKGCKVKGGEFTTRKLRFTSKSQIADEVKFEPIVGITIAEFTIEGCTIAALNGAYTMTGFFRAQPDGATLNTSVAQTEGTLALRGQRLGLTTAITLRGTDKKAGDAADKPLSPTTVETP